MEEDLFGSFMLFGGGLVMLAFGVLFAEATWDSVSLALSRPRWQFVPGQIVTSSVEERPDPESLNAGKEYCANIRYEYVVDGHSQVGSDLELVSAYFDWVKDRERAAKQVEQYPIGASVTVYYDPATPHLSALNLHCSVSTLGALAFAAIFNAGVGLFMAWFAMSLLV